MDTESLCQFEWVNEAAGLARCVGCGDQKRLQSLKTVRRCRARPPSTLHPPPSTCLHRSEPKRVEQCESCQGQIELPVYGCAVHGECTLESYAARNKNLAGVHVCAGCPEKKAAEPAPVHPATKIVNYAGAQLRDRWGGRKRRSTDLVARIFDKHCKGCRLFNSALGECGKCGCPVRRDGDPEVNKLAWAHESCPIGKWPIQTANLIFYLLPLKHPDHVWPWHVEQLRQRLSIFNGRKIVWIATRGPKEFLALDKPEVVRAAFGNDAAGIEFHEAPNDQQHWETPAFRWMLRALHLGKSVEETKGIYFDSAEALFSMRSYDEPEIPTPSPSEATFYFHAKGVRRAQQSAIRPWCEAIYHHCLDRWDEVREILSVWPCCGIARQATNPTTMGGDGWHFAGTGFWFNHAALFSRGNAWDTIHDHSHAVEAYLATQFPFEAGYCLAHDNAGGSFGGVYKASTWIDWQRVDRPSEIVEQASRRPPPDDLRVLILGHDRRRLEWAAELPHGRKILLGDLDPDNDLAESRLFRWPELEQALDRPYVALCTDRWDSKYQGRALPLAELDRLERSPHVVWGARTTSPDWITDSERSHPGMAEILFSLVDSLALSDADVRRPSLWSNNLLAHRDVILDLAGFHRRLLPFTLDRWGARPPYHSPAEDPSRHLSYLAERLTVLFFCWRRDLAVRRIPGA